MMRNMIILLLSMVIFNNAAVAEKITITAGEWAPYLSENSRYNGIAGRIITEAFSENGIEITFRFVPWKRAYNEAANGSADATALWLKKPEREKFFFYSDEVITETHVFFYKKGSGFNWETITDIIPYKIGALLGFSYGKELDTLIKGKKIKLQRTIRDEQNFLKLLKGRIDIYPQEINVGYECIYSNFLKGEIALINHHPRPFMTNPSFLLFPKKNVKSEHLHKTFNRALLKLKSTGKVRKFIMDARKGV